MPRLNTPATQSSRAGKGNATRSARTLARNGRALVLVTVCVLFGTLALSAPAFASKPEIPTVQIAERSPSSAVLLGTLNPGAAEPREGGTYQFVYRATTSGTCKGAGEQAAPETPALSAGAPHEELMPEVLGGLTPGTEYAVCLVATEPGKTEQGVSAPATFVTRVTPEGPEIRPPTAVTSSGATFHAVLNPNAPGEAGDIYQFLYRVGTECNGTGQQALPESGIPVAGAQAEAVSAQATGLLPKTTYSYCAIMFNELVEFAESESVTFETPVGVPAVSGLAAVSVKSVEVTIGATVSPGGASTTLAIAGAGIAAATKRLPASSTPVQVQQVLSGLTPGTTYTVDVSAHNEAGTTEAELTFKTAGSAPSEEASVGCPNRAYSGFRGALPNCSAVELVSPSGEIGEVYDPGGAVSRHEEAITTARPFRAAADGGRVTYLADPGLSGGDGSTAKAHGNQYLATLTGRGWVSENITPPVGEGESASFEREYKYFSTDLNSAVVLSQTPLLAASPVPQGPRGCQVLYAVGVGSGFPSYSAMFDETLSPGFCGTATESNAPLAFAGETPDHTVKVLDSSAALVAPAVEPQSGFGGNVYASRGDGELSVVNVLPNGTVEPDALAGGPSELTANGPDDSNVISPDGSKVVWSAVTPQPSVNGSPAPFPTALYVRENPFGPSAATVQLDKAEAGAPGPSGGGQFWTAAATGADVFFTDCHKLTIDSTADEAEGCTRFVEGNDIVKTGSDLYEYVFSPAGGTKLVDLTVDHDPQDLFGADVQGVIGTSEDGSYVYFIAGGAMGAGPNSRGEEPASGSCKSAQSSAAGKEELAGHVPASFGCNLFLLHFNGAEWEAPRFIARLAAIDNVVGDTLNAPGASAAEISGDWNPRLGSRTAEVSPSGTSLVLSSTQELTGYDVSSAGTARETHNQGGNEIFLYGAATGSLTCVSCDPQNRPPDVSAMTKTGYTTYLPVSSSDTFLHRWVNGAGTEVVFNSSQPLVPKDVNSTQDVYAWEAEGTPSCSSATSVFGGCVFLLTAGESSTLSFFADMDESGSNIFVAHRGPLYGVGEVGTKSALYDVHADGGESTPPSEGCTTGCGLEPAPLVATLSPSTATVAAGGNLLSSVTKRAVVAKKCKKGFRKKRDKCVRSRANKKVKSKKVNRPSKANRERRGQ